MLSKFIAGLLVIVLVNGMFQAILADKHVCEFCTTVYTEVTK